ncbi:MAG: glycosyltransferase family 4 protein [Bacillota bacterium]|jgi:glycosyltransferase involved in cell wall biosynthesis
MKILYLTQYFFTPNQAGGSRHYHQVKYLADCGHKVDVLTSYVQDHMSRAIAEKYRGKLFVKEYWGNITVYKTYASGNYGRGFLDRMKNYLSFMFCALICGLKIPGNYDLVFASSPSLFVGGAGYLLSKWKKGRFVLEVRDLWPRSAIVLGFLKNKIFIKMARWLEIFLYRKAALIIAVTGGIEKAVGEALGDNNKVKLITNGIDPDFFSQPQLIDFKKRYGLEGKFINIYVGAHGVNNDLETIIEAADRLKDFEEIQFVFVGGGDHKANIINMCAERVLRNVHFLPPQPKNTVKDLLKSADVCLLAIKKDTFFQGTLPNKLFDYLASGKPVVAAVPHEGESASLIAHFQGGIVCSPENGAEMAQAILKLYQDTELRNSFGGASRTDALRCFSRERLAAELEESLKNTVQGKGNV